MLLLILSWVSTWPLMAIFYRIFSILDSECHVVDGTATKSDGPPPRSTPERTAAAPNHVPPRARRRGRRKTAGTRRDGPGADVDRCTSKDAGELNGRTVEVNGKIKNTLATCVLMATPPLSTRLDTLRTISDCEPNLLNNMTPKRNMRNIRTGPYIDNLCTSSSTALLKTQRMYKFRSNSSTSKLRSPGVEKTPITIDVSTQTVKFEQRRLIKREETLHLESCVDIFETPPRVKAPVNVRKKVDVDKLEFKPLNLNKIRYKKLRNFSEILFGEAEIKNLSDAEISFQNLIEPTDISTPIQKRKVDNSNFKNSNANNRPKEKVKVKKFETSLVMKRRYKTISPRKTREIAIRNIPPTYDTKKKNEKSLIPKSFTPPRATHIKPTENILNVSADQGRFVSRAKRFHTRFVARWIARISEICNWLGLSLKKTLSPTTGALPCKPKLANHATPMICGHCEELRTKLLVITSKMEVLEREQNKSAIESREVIAGLVAEIARIKTEISEIEILKKQVKEMEAFVRCRCATIQSAPPPPPPPPPCAPPLPPPLPPPILALNLDSAARCRSGSIKRLERKSNENSRPVISLDDILKVKLKKTTDRPLPARRTQQQPLVSVEMLSQIKLKPTSRPETPCDRKRDGSITNTSGALQSSPAASLLRLLGNVDANEAYLET